jgi:hypothetical protein
VDVLQDEALTSTESIEAESTEGTIEGLNVTIVERGMEDWVAILIGLIIGAFVTVAVMAYRHFNPVTNPSASSVAKQRPATNACALPACQVSENQAPVYQPQAPSCSAECKVCFDKEADHLCMPCGHMCCCRDCLEAVRRGGGLCPICRARITAIQRVYR